MGEAHVLRDDLIEYIGYEIIRLLPLNHVDKLAVTCGEQLSTGTESRKTGANITLCDASGKNCLHIYLEGAGSKDTERVEDFTQMVEYLIDRGVPTDGLDKAENQPEHYISERMKDAYQNIIEKKVWDEMKNTRNEPSMNQGPASLPKTGSARQEPVRMAQSMSGRGQISQDIIGGSPRIEDIEGPAVGLGQGQPRGLRDEEQGQALDEDGEEEEPPNIPEMCESCEEEPIRFKMEPCGHFLCADCIPRKKQKKKTCAVCGEAAIEVVEIRH